MKKVPQITTRSPDGCPKDKEMKRLVKECGNEVVEAMRIPEPLLLYADPQSSAVVKYKLENPSTVPAAPLEPTLQGSEGAGELELELASRNVSSEARNDNNIPQGGGVSIIGVVEERVVKRPACKKRKDCSTTIVSSRVTTSFVDPSSANTPVSMDNIERYSSSMHIHLLAI